MTRASRLALAVSAAAAVTAHAELTAAFKSGAATDSRLDRLPALLVKAGEAPTPFIAPGPFEVTWSGKLTVAQRQRLAFSFEGEGSAALEIDGKPVIAEDGTLGAKASESTRLNPGDHDIRITFKSKPDGSGRFRLFWEERTFPKQTVPPSAFRTDADETAKQGELVREGRRLFAANYCVKCHAPEEGLGPAPMPETAEIGPLLAGIADRATEEWLRQWIGAPHQMRPETHMPALVDASTPEGKKQTANLAAYVATLTFGAPAPAAPDAALAKKGGEKFHDLGCVACHTMPDQVEADTVNRRVPLNNVAFKFKPGALTGYLKKPDAFHPLSGMPDFRLGDDEAAEIAAYLLSASKDKAHKPLADLPAGDAAEGEKLAKSLQCGTCHPGLPLPDKSPAPALEAIFAKDWSAGGCVAPADKRGKAPVLNLDEPGRTALVAFSKTGTGGLKRDTPSEFVRRQTTALRCTACHANDGHGALLSSVHKESAGLVAGLKGHDERLDQSRPQLTYLGEMLHASYLESMIQGTADPRPRPWLLARMPAFHAKAKSMAEGFARMHGVEPSGPAPVTVDPATAEIGKTLVGADGFGCTTCHGIGDAKPTAAFEVEGINFSLVPQRLRADYFHRWMDNPGSVTPGTKMPRYSEANQSQRTDVLDGDARKQFEAIWQYLHSQGK